MEMSPAELERLGQLSMKLVGAGVQAGIDGTQANPQITDPAELHRIVMERLMPIISTHYTVAIIQAQLRGDLVVE